MYGLKRSRLVWTLAIRDMHALRDILRVKLTIFDELDFKQLKSNMRILCLAYFTSLCPSRLQVSVQNSYGHGCQSIIKNPPNLNEIFSVPYSASTLNELHEVLEFFKRKFFFKPKCLDVFPEYNQHPSPLGDVAVISNVPGKCINTIQRGDCFPEYSSTLQWRHNGRDSV